ncbi:hypothetical protein J7T55_011213 [Diaporthe amygdali]|uniref:uncharacterized protein n=1 Tax=Phomopsis amygdali TaxID=1214568 RepID=UPI0022FE83FB|nr:uncharacterized protein J7T55_011213 [Diaporthe amygdali]KAJ0108723.1 hypothetical protein J7T55_011213 [Diaporthe amygdali]
MLSIFLSKHLENNLIAQHPQCELKRKQRLALFFFCDGSDTQKSSETGILRGLLFQAIRQRPSLLGHLIRICEDQSKDLFQDWSFECLWTVLRAFLLDAAIPGTLGLKEDELEDPQNPSACIIVDGLDECEAPSIRRLVHKLSRLEEDDELRARMKVIVISRERPNLRYAFVGRYLQLNLEDPRNAQAVFADVQRYIVQQVDSIASADKKDYPEELRNSVASFLSQNTQAKFLWVFLVMTELEATSRIEAWEQLSRLPSTIDALYEWMIMKIPHQWRETLSKVLLWVTLAYRPLSVAELATALDERRLGLTDSEIIRGCVSHCGQILRTAADGTIHPVHHSAREYLYERLESAPSFFKDCVELNPFNLKEGHKFIASFCIKNLVIPNWPGIRDSGKRSKKNEKTRDRARFSSGTSTALSDYAREFWARHIRNAEDLMLEIADSHSELFGENSSTRGLLAHEFSKGLLTMDTPILHFAAYHGFTPLVQRLLKRGWRNKLRARRLMRQKDSLGRTALHLATHYHDNVPIVELLLGRGADVSCKDHAGATALDHATKYGTPEMVSFLVAQGQQ